MILTDPRQLQAIKGGWLGSAFIIFFLSSTILNNTCNGLFQIQRYMNLSQKFFMFTVLRYLFHTGLYKLLEVVSILKFKSVTLITCEH